MLDKSIRDKRNELRKKSYRLRELLFDVECSKAEEMMIKQDKAYKQWKFYDNIIKRLEGLEKDEMQDKKE